MWNSDFGEVLQKLERIEKEGIWENGKKWDKSVRIERMVDELLFKTCRKTIQFEKRDKIVWFVQVD